MATDEKPAIGNFRAQPKTAMRGSFGLPDDLAKETAEQSSAKAEEAAAGKEEAAKEIPKTTAELYLAALKVADVARAEAADIYDAILTKGFYTEAYKVSEVRRVVFRTRSYEDTQRLRRAFESIRPLQVTADEMTQRYQLAASLEEWAGMVYKHENDEDFDKVLKAVEALPEQAYYLLTRNLFKFDKKIATIFSEGCEDVF